MATAADAAQSRDEAEAQAETLYAAAVALVAAQLLHEDTDDDHLLAVAIMLAAVLYRSAPRRYGSSVSLERINVDPDGVAEELGPDLARQARKHAEDHFDTIHKRTLQDPAATHQDAVQAFKDDTAWVKAAARSTATQIAAETAIELLPLVDDDTGVKHHLLWVSRGDHRVRKTHRKLHGDIREPGKPFKTFPSGQTLRFPGDPLAPIGETANCRCALLLVPAAEARSVRDLFKVRDDDWDAIDGMAATLVGLAASVGWGQDDMERAVTDWINERQ